MTVQTKVFTVALDGTNQPQPLTLIGLAVGFVTTRYVVVNNLTPYIMQLVGVGNNNTNQATVLPGTSQKFQWSNQIGSLTATWVNPITGAPPSTPQVVCEYSDDPQGADLPGNYPSTLQSGVTIGSLTGPVTISGPVAISSVAGTVSIAGTVSLSIGTSVTVSNTVTITPSGTINVQGVAGGTTIGIAGVVSLTGGTTVNIGTVAGTVSIAGTVTANISGTPSVTISGTPNVNVTAGSLNVGTVGSITANVSVAPAVTSLYQNSLLALASPLNQTITAAQSFLGARLTFQNLSGAGSMQLFVQFTNNNTLEVFSAQVRFNSGDQKIISLPVAANTGDTLLFHLAATGTFTNGLVSLVSLGQVDTVGLAGVPLAGYAVGGAQFASVVVSSGTPTQILAAPPSNMSYRLHRYGVAVGTGFTAYSSFIMGIQNNGGNPYDAQTIVFPSAQTGAGAGVALEGIITDNTAVKVNQIGLLGATATMWLRYDLVATPAIL